MQYLGSKNRISKELVPIIQSFITKDTTCYYEPFVGGANIIDKINFKNKIGSDIHKELIALLNAVKDGEEMPETISEEEYQRVKEHQSSYKDWYVGLVGFCATFSAKYFGGYARNKKRSYDYPAGAIRSLKKQASKLKDIAFICQPYDCLTKDAVKNAVIYCDPPYRDTTKYSTKGFDYEKFYNWCREMSENNIVLISEYSMPDDFECIWQKEYFVNLSSKRTSKQPRIERLFIYKGGKKE